MIINLLQTHQLEILIKQKVYINVFNKNIPNSDVSIQSYSITHDDQVLGLISLKQFDRYPKFNSWSFGDNNNNNNSAAIARLYTLLKNASRKQIGEIVWMGSFSPKFTAANLFTVLNHLSISKYRALFIVSQHFINLTEDWIQIHPHNLIGSDSYLFWVYIPRYKHRIASNSDMNRCTKEITTGVVEDDYGQLKDIENHIVQYAASKGIKRKHISQLSSDMFISKREFMELSGGYVSSDILDTQLSQPDMSGYLISVNNKLRGIIVYTPFHKDNYPPPIFRDSLLDNADPVFTLDNGDITSKVYNGYDIHVLCATRGLGRLLLAMVLLDIRKYHGCVITLSVGKKDGVPNDNAISLYKEFGFVKVDVLFSKKYGRLYKNNEHVKWETQHHEEDPIDEPIFMCKFVDRSTKMFTLKDAKSLLCVQLHK